MKQIWAIENLKKWISIGKKTGQLADLLMEKASDEGYAFSEGEIIDLIRDLEVYKDKIIKDRSKHIAKNDFDTISVFPEPDDLEQPHFARYIRNLSNKGWDDDLTDRIIIHTTSIADAIITANRANWPEKKMTKGLVMGHVQSGKTANMAGVMALSADLGFDLVIVLSGIHNKLNDQTTKRFENDLWTYDKYAVEMGLDQSAMRKLKSRNESWSLITKESDLLDNNTSTLNVLTGPVLGVFKKNIKVLERLYKWMQQHYKDTLQGIKVLVIDDECDQASPNVSDISANEVSAINGKLWEIMNLIPNVAYVGYTATPFASILNEPPGFGSLYPSDFIYTLPTNEKYFGIKEFFGSPDDPEENGMDLIRIVPELDDDLTADYTTLKNAIGYFLCTSTVRKFCRNEKGHMTMMIHVSFRVDDQDDVAVMAEVILEDFERNIPETLKYLKKLWTFEKSKVKPDDLVKYNGGHRNDYQLTENFEDFSNFITDTLKDVQIRIDNYKKPDEMRLSYGEEHICVIAIGGNTLSRGVTLEGLNVSYFTRSGNQYDSLLQMGRWFGYRNGYEDLVRIWTSAKNAEHFSHLSLVEQDLRNQVTELYKSGGASPEEIALNVISHPSMKIVRKSAQQGATHIKTSFFNTAPQTTFFLKDNIDWLKNNWTAGQTLLKSAFDKNSKKESIFNPATREVFRVEVEEVLKFLKCAKPHAIQDGTLNGEMLYDFIKHCVKEGYLSNWNICVPSVLSSGNGSDLKHYRLINRSRIADSDDGIAYIKALRGKGDLVSDIDERQLSEKLTEKMDINTTKARMDILESKGFLDYQMPGLLLLYPIDKDSEARDDDNTLRKNLEAKHPVLGWSVVFPAFKQDTKFVNRVGINLDNYVS